MPVKMIDFTARWCGPCRQMEPVLASVAKEYASQGVELVAIDVDDEPVEAQRFNVRSIRHSSSCATAASLVAGPAHSSPVCSTV